MCLTCDLLSIAKLQAGKTCSAREFLGCTNETYGKWAVKSPQPWKLAVISWFEPLVHLKKILFMLFWISKQQILDNQCVTTNHTYLWAGTGDGAVVETYIHSLLACMHSQCKSLYLNDLNVMRGCWIGFCILAISDLYLPCCCRNLFDLRLTDGPSSFLGKRH